jgi:hypothetical protein
LANIHKNVGGNKIILTLKRINKKGENHIEEKEICYRGYKMLPHFREKNFSREFFQIFKNRRVCEIFGKGKENLGGIVAHNNLDKFFEILPNSRFSQTYWKSNSFNPLPLLLKTLNSADQHLKKGRKTLQWFSEVSN